MAETWANDGGTERKLTSLWVNDWGVERELQELWVNDGGVERLIFQSTIEHHLRPDGDISNTGSFSDSDGDGSLWDELDETTADTATYVSKTHLSTTLSNYAFEVSLSNPSTTPSASQTHTVRVRARVRAISGTVATGTMTVRLKNGTTTVVTSSAYNVASSSYITRSFNLSAAQIAALGTYTNLRVNVSLAMQGSSVFDEIEGDVTWIELYIAP